MKSKVKYYFECIKAAKYGLMYKDEAEAARQEISRLRAENALLREQYTKQAEIVRALAAK